MAKSKDFLFATDHTRFYFPWICFIMVFIATFLTGVGLLVHNSLASWRQGVSESLTIQIATHDSEGKFRGDLIPVDVEKALSIVRTTPGIKGASIINDDQMSELMAPWIGADVAIENLPLPKLIDVAIDPDNPPYLEQLKSELANQVPAASLDSHRIWLNDLVKISNRVIHIIGFVLILLLATIVFTVIYTTQAALSIHESAISLVHMMGAKDFYITNQYAWYNLKRSLCGGILGFISTIPILLLLIYCLNDFTDSVLQSNLTHLQWGLLTGIPFGLACICFVTTFKTVLRYLKRFL